MTKRKSVTCSVSISGELISHVRLCLDLARIQASNGKVLVQKSNSFTHFAFPAFISAVASLEAYINESLLSDVPRAVFHKSALWQLDKKFIEECSLLTKLIITPHLLFGKTFKKGEQPFQDLQILLKVRNDIVHYKMKSRIPSYVEELSRRGIALANPKNGSMAWAHRISTTRAIVWSHNTVCAVVEKLSAIIADGSVNACVPFTAGNFTPMKEPR